MSIQPQSAYPTAEQVMNRARAIVNDAFRGGSGRVLTDSAPMSIEFLNSALEELQDKLDNSSAQIFLIQDNIILTPITALPAPNPATQIFISYNGFFDGTTMQKEPFIPSNVVTILRCWERQTGSGLPFQDMEQAQDGLPSVLQGVWLGAWEYRQDKIYLTGSTQTEDLRVRAATRLEPIGSNTNLADTQIGILASINALATLVAYHYALARGAQAAQAMKEDAAEQSRYIMRRYSRRAQRIPYNRRGYGESGDLRTTWLPW